MRCCTEPCLRSLQAPSSNYVLTVQADMRLSVFARLLTEEWPAATAAAYLYARTALVRPDRQLTCIEYPPQAGKPSPWVCLNKAAAIADAALGIRSEHVREAFLVHLRSSCVPVSHTVY